MREDSRVVFNERFGCGAMIIHMKERESQCSAANFIRMLQSDFE